LSCASPAVSSTRTAGRSGEAGRGARSRLHQKENNSFISAGASTS